MREREKERESHAFMFQNRRIKSLQENKRSNKMLQFKSRIRCGNSMLFSPPALFSVTWQGSYRIHYKNIRRFYGKITGNQLPVHFPLCFTGIRKHFQESGTERLQRTLLFLLSYSPTILQRYFRVLSVNITLPYLDF